MGTLETAATVHALMRPGKGSLAMDESNPTCNKRFAKLGIPQTAEAHRASLPAHGAQMIVTMSRERAEPSGVYVSVTFLSAATICRVSIQP
jgi:fructose-bisphosphate aldolase class 1